MKKTELRIFLENDESLRLQVAGDDITIAKMLATAMCANLPLMAIICAATAAAMEQKGISTLDLKKLAHKSGIRI